MKHEDMAALHDEIARLRAALELFIVTVNPPYPQSMALWQEHLKAATKTARQALTGPKKKADRESADPTAKADG